jgi:hypothetical protein
MGVHEDIGDLKKWGRRETRTTSVVFSGETGCCLSKLKNMLRKMITETKSKKEKLTMKQSVNFSFQLRRELKVAM